MIRTEDEMASKSKDTEITLDVFKLLALFFGLVALCGVFFGLGYAWGNKSAKAVDRDSLAQPPTISTDRPSATRGAEKAQIASGAVPAKADETAADQKAPKNPAAEIEPTAAQSSASDSPASARAAVTGSSYFVQVAAVTKQEDAEALVDALKRKQYPAMISGTSTDKLFHVQLGPYGDLKEAEAMRAKLVTDGYNPIVKK